MRMPIALSPLARRARIPRHPALSVPGLGLINTGWHHGSVTTQARWKSSDQARPSTESFSRKEVAKRRRMEAKEPSGGDTGHGPHPLDSSRDVRKEALDAKKDEKVFRPARLPIVLCHGFCGFDTLGTNPDFRFDYWYGVREALGEIGCRVYTARVPPFAGIEQRAERLCAYIEKTVPHGSEINLVGHSMGGLDCRFLISHLKSSHFKVRSLTTLGTPHRGSSFADYVMTDIVGQVHLEMFWKMMGVVGIERGAADNLTIHYLQNEFNPKTPDDPQVAYFSYGGTFEPNLFSRFRFSWKVIMDREGPNDGLVSLQSAQWGKFVRAIPNADHLDLMNWINALSWGRARFPWILGGSSHDPEGRPKGAFEMDNDDENDKDMPREESPLFNAIELYLEISDMLNKQGF